MLTESASRYDVPAMTDPLEPSIREAMADLQAGRLAPGVEKLRGVLAARPDFAELWSNLGYGLRAMGRPAEAREALGRAVQLQPALADAWNLLGLVAHDEEGYEEAEGHYDRALRLKAGFVEALMNRANARQAAGRSDAALADYAQALQVAPGNAQVHYNLGHLFHKATGDLDRALGSYREAVRLEPGFAMAHHNLSHALFLRGDLDEAWRESRWRPGRMQAEAALAKNQSRYFFPKRGALGRTRIVVVAEQGLGDVLFYLRFAPRLRELGATLDFAGPQRLHGMLARTGLFERLGLATDPMHVPGAFELLAGDMPLLLEQEMGEVPLPPPLPLVAESSRVERLLGRLRELGPAPYVALAWRSGTPRTGPFERLFKEAPVDALRGILAGKPGTLVSVQREPRDGETAALAEALGRPVHDFSGVNPDLDDALALMSAAGDYVGVSSTLLHLRAGTGGGGTVLVPFPWEWRWMAKGASPWFPGVKPVREQPGGGWDYG